MTDGSIAVEKQIDEYGLLLRQVKEGMQQTIVGMEEVIDQLLIALAANGHVLLEGVPGLGKSLLVQTLGRLLDAGYTRIQFTPDLMPSDITGTNIIFDDDRGNRSFRFQPGPLFSHLVLADEINRATAKTQSALLEAMQERSISVAGVTRRLDPPFFVMATQNPLEMEGTYPLPEAQIDRFFFKSRVNYPSFPELLDILRRTTGGEGTETKATISKTQLLAVQRLIRQLPAAGAVLEYCARLALTTHPQNAVQRVPKIAKYVRWGASPRGAQTLVLAAKAAAFMAGRCSVSFKDVRDVALPALRHRLLLNLEGEAAEQDVDELLLELLEAVPETE